MVRTSLDDIAASTAQDAVKDQVVANKATVDSDLMHGTTDLAHKLAQQGIGRKTAGGAQQVGLHAVCHYLLVSSSLAAQQGVGRKTVWVHNRWACMQCTTTCWFLLLRLHSKALVGRQLGVHNRWYCAQCATSRWSFGCPSLACVTMQ